MTIATNNKQQVRVRTFNGGMNSSSEPDIVPVGFATNIENGIIDKLGKVTQRKGTTRVGDDPATLISNWTFDASDSTDDEGDNDGTDTAITYATGKFGKAAEFNGTTSKITIDADTTIDAVDMVAFRLSAWVYVDTDGENDVGRIFDKWSGTKVGYRLWVFGESSSTVKVSFEVGYGTTNALANTTTTMSTGAWHKIDAIHNADKSLDIYIDGDIATYDDDVSGDGDLSDDGAVDLTIGNETAAATKTFDGRIDSARIYDGAFAAWQLDQEKIGGITRFKVGTTLDAIFRINGTRIEYLHDDVTDWSYLSGTTLTADLQTEFIQAKDLLFVLNGTDNVHTINSSKAVTDEADTNVDPPKSTVGEYMPNNRLFLSGSLTASERDYLWYSDALDPQTFDRTVNVIKIRTGATDKITQIKSFRDDELIIYKEDSIFKLNTRGATPLSDWELDIFNPGIGCKAPRTVVKLGDEHIFLGTDGVRLLTRTQFDKVQNGIISSPVDDLISRINQDQVHKCCATFYDEKYVLAVPLDSALEPNFLLIYDLLAVQQTGDFRSGWTCIPLNNWFPTQFVNYEFSDNDYALMYADNRDISTVHRAFNGNLDDGKAIEMVIEGPRHSVNRANFAVWNPMFIVANSSDNTSMEVHARARLATYESLGKFTITNFGGVDLAVNLPFNLGGGNLKTEKYLNSKKLGKGRTVQYKFVHNERNKSATLNEYSVWARPKG